MGRRTHLCFAVPHLCLPLFQFLYHVHVYMYIILLYIYVCMQIYGPDMTEAHEHLHHSTYVYST